MSTNYKILTKDPSLKEYWEERIGCSLPDDAEYWPKPEKDEEIFLSEREAIQQQLLLRKN